MNIGINIPEYNVSQFNQLFKKVVENNFDYIRIRGEISEIKNAASGHVYLTLKDDNSILNATIWNQKKNYLKFNPEVGMEIIATGKISTYAKSISTYSINIEQIELAGEGALLKLIEDRKKNLEKKGFFDEKHKKKIPFLPSKIGVITSPTGSVIHDIINRIKDRFPTDIDIWPVPVQGTKAAESIIEAIYGFNNLDNKNKPSIIIIARGGGSIEDLMPFNDEDLALAVFKSKIPIISAIGHETDITIIDFVSDIRASTPTAAAEKSVPIKTELSKSVLSLTQRLSNSIQNKFQTIDSSFLNLSKFLKAPNLIINSYRDKFNNINLVLSKEVNNIYDYNFNQLKNFFKLLRTPIIAFENHEKYLKKLTKDINRAITVKHKTELNEYSKFNRLLESNSLHTNLKKGFSIIRKNKKIISNSKLITNDELLNIQFLDKSINVKVKKIS